jgi:DNA-binding transcriptional LysR family regulator
MRRLALFCGGFAAGIFLAQYLLPELLAQYMKQITGVRYHLRRGDSAQIHKLLHSGSVRLGFVGAMLEPDSMTYFPMLEDHLVMCTANNPHYQALKKQNVYGRDLLREPTVAREEGSGTDRTVQSYMRNMGLADQDLHIVARVDDPEAIKRMTAQGVGVSVLSALSVASEVDDGRLLTFPMDPQGLHRSIYLVYPRETILSQSEQAFVRFCRQMAIRRNL